MANQWERDGFAVSTDPARLDLDAIHGFLRECYWAKDIPREVMERSIRGAIPFGVYEDEALVGFARVVSDRATVAYVGDVFILEPWRGRGLSKFLMECVLAHPDLQGLRRWFLLTRDAHGLYGQFGFTPLRVPERWMERWSPDLYQRSAPTSKV